MIDINKLRRKLHSDDPIDHVDIHANVKPILTELLDRLEDAESDALEQARLNGMGASREASLMAKLAAAETAWKVSDKSLYDLTEKVIPNLRDQLETAEKDIALKERIIDSLGAELNAVAKERDALRARIEAMEKQDPAAWQRQHRSFGPDAWMETTGSVAERLKTEDGWKVRPLYLAPGAQAAVPEDIHRDAMRYRALRNIPAEYPAVFAHPGADDYGWFPVYVADLDEASDVLIAAAPKQGERE